MKKLLTPFDKMLIQSMLPTLSEKYFRYSKKQRFSMALKFYSCKTTLIVLNIFRCLISVLYVVLLSCSILCSSVKYWQATVLVLCLGRL